MGYTEVFPIRGEQGRAKYARENRKLLAERILVLVHVLEPHALLVGLHGAARHAHRRESAVVVEVLDVLMIEVSTFL